MFGEASGVGATSRDNREGWSRPLGRPFSGEHHEFLLHTVPGRLRLSIRPIAGTLMCFSQPHTSMSHNSRGFRARRSTNPSSRWLSAAFSNWFGFIWDDKDQEQKARTSGKKTTSSTKSIISAIMVHLQAVDSYYTSCPFYNPL